MRSKTGQSGRGVRSAVLETARRTPGCPGARLAKAQKSLRQRVAYVLSKQTLTQQALAKALKLEQLGITQRG